MIRQMGLLEYNQEQIPYVYTLIQYVELKHIFILNLLVLRQRKYQLLFHIIFVRNITSFTRKNFCDTGRLQFACLNFGPKSVKKYQGKKSHDLTRKLQKFSSIEEIFFYSRNFLLLQQKFSMIIEIFYDSRNISTIVVEIFLLLQQTFSTIVVEIFYNRRNFLQQQKYFYDSRNYK